MMLTNKTHKLRQLRPLLLCIVFQLVSYFGSRLVNQGRVFHDPSTALDALIPLAPWFVTIYIFSYVTWVVGFAAVAWESKETCRRLVWADGICKGLSLIIFVAWPTAMVRPALTGGGVCNWLLGIVYAADQPNNLLPSLHCAMNWLCWRAALPSKTLPGWYKWFYFVFALLVFASVVFTKQHSASDIIPGILVAELGWQGSRLVLNRQRELSP